VQMKSPLLHDPLQWLLEPFGWYSGQFLPDMDKPAQQLQTSLSFPPLHLL